MADFDGGAAHHATPDVVGYPAYDVEMVSPELPCGSAWLANCLLELGVPIWKPWNMRLGDDWENLGAHRFRYANAAEPLKHMLPALKIDREFDFLPSPVPRVFHYWPGFYAPVEKTILFVRDPRDTLYSVWKRALSVGLIDLQTSFPNFVDSDYFHYPISWNEYQILFLLVWKDWLTVRDHLILRYEDYRADPIATLQRATDFLGVDVDANELHRATTLSSFEHLHRLESESIARGDIAKRFNRAGIASEYRRTFDSSMHAAFDARYDTIFDWLGYDTNPVRTKDSIRTLDVESFLTAMRIDEAQSAFRPWLRATAQRIADDMAS